jgi:hypothetical protein
MISFIIDYEGQPHAQILVLSAPDPVVEKKGQFPFFSKLKLSY